jgi:GT2 family glycosyltransferase
MDNKIDAIILSYASNEELYKTTQTLIDSYISTANELINKIFVIESYKQFNKTYNSKKVELFIPEEEFGYNKFFNIGLKHCESEFVAGPNNDVIIHPNCLQTIVKEFHENSEISSICPVDRNWHRHTKMYLPTDNKLYHGYEVSLHMFGCMFCCRRNIFETIGYLDEDFYFFYQDNDYVMCLERCNLLHGVHTGANITHHSGHSDRQANQHLKYTPDNMNIQGHIFANKWKNSEPFKSGGFRKFKEYKI